MTTDYPPGTPAGGPVGPAGNVPPNRDDAAGCAGGWWLILILIIIAIIWWAGWGWGTSGGYWFRRRPVNTAPATVAPVNPPVERNGTPAHTATPTTHPATTHPAGGAALPMQWDTGRHGIAMAVPALALAPAA